MARFYSNENFPLPAVEQLRQLGHDVLTSYDAGNANQSIPDEQVLAFAATKNRILLTMNRLHFLRLHNAGMILHAGIVVCTFDPDFTELAQRVHNQTAQVSQTNGVLLRVKRSTK